MIPGNSRKIILQLNQLNVLYLTTCNKRTKLRMLLMIVVLKILTFIDKRRIPSKFQRMLSQEYILFG